MELENDLAKYNEKNAYDTSEKPDISERINIDLHSDLRNADNPYDQAQAEMFDKIDKFTQDLHESSKNENDINKADLYSDTKAESTNDKSENNNKSDLENLSSEQMDQKINDMIKSFDEKVANGIDKNEAFDKTEVEFGIKNTNEVDQKVNDAIDSYNQNKE